MADFGELGRDEGEHRGPEPGDGADVAQTPDVEGTPNDALPDYRGQARKDPDKKPGPMKPNQD